MGVDYSLACGDCKEFIDLHKWPVVELAAGYLVHAHFRPGEYPAQLRPEDSPFPFRDLASNCKKILITAGDIQLALQGQIPDQPYIHELNPIVRDFAGQHEGHDLFLICDMGDPGENPWDAGREGFAEWKMVPGAFNFNRYLPRNLIEVERCTSWPDVLERLRLEWPFCYSWNDGCRAEIEAIRRAFEERLSRRSD